MISRRLVSCSKRGIVKLAVQRNPQSEQQTRKDNDPRVMVNDRHVAQSDPIHEKLLLGLP
jgi:ubiquitin